MKPAPFTLHEPTSVTDAVRLLAEHGDDAKVLAGGQSLTPMLALRLTRFEHLVDLHRIGELAGIRVDGDALVVGAMTTQATVERDATVAARVPLLARAVRLIGHRAVRTRGTIGGSLAHADPASELPAVALALDAEFRCTGPGGTRSVPAHAFVLGTWTTALADDEVLTEIRFPVATGGDGSAIEEVARRHGDFALAGAAVALHVDAGRVTRAAIGLFGLAPNAVRAPSGEAALRDTKVDRLDAEAVGRAAIADADPSADLHASAEYRADVGATLVARAVTRAVEAATRA